MSPILVVIAPGFHLFPFRTEKLSLVTPMVLHTRGRVGSRQLISKTPSRAIRRESFWVSIAAVGKNGVVREPAVHEEVLRNFISLVQALGFTLRNLTFSPVKGPEGNIEFLGHLSMLPQGAMTPDVKAIIAAAHETL